MKNYVFGKDISFTFFPLDADGQPLTAASGNPTIYVYQEQPSRDQAQNGTGSPLQTISSWTQNGNGYTFTISALSDPEPDSDNHAHTFWLGINYRLQSGEDLQLVLRSFVVARVTGQDTELSVAISDLEVYFSEIDSYLTEAKQAALTVAAVGEIKTALRNAGYEWARIRRPDWLHEAAIAKTLQLFALGQVAAGTEGFETLHDEMKERFGTFISSLQLDYDADQDGKVDETPAQVLRSAFITR